MYTYRLIEVPDHSKYACLFQPVMLLVMIQMGCFITVLPLQITCLKYVVRSMFYFNIYYTILFAFVFVYMIVKQRSFILFIFLRYIIAVMATYY